MSDRVDTQSTWTVAGEQALATALGRRHRSDPVLPGTGGPAGNVRLTAWTGAVLLVLFLAELVTLLDVRGLIGWHLALGVLLVPPALLKTVSTGWRILRYYVGHRPYTSAGPPPLLLRLLGPLVVLGTLALLGTGLALVAVGADGGRQALVTVLGQRISTLTLHQAAFIFWGVVTGLHVLARALPAWMALRPGSGDGVPGRSWRAVALLASLGLGVAGLFLILQHDNGWRSAPDRHGVFQEHGDG